MPEKYQPSQAVIIDATKGGEHICAAGGRISTQPGNAMEILEKSTDPEKNANLIEKVTKSGHNSTVEHIFFNLAFNNVSVMVEQFLIEYRLASFTVKSRRYVDFSHMGYIVPNFIQERQETEYRQHMDFLFEQYQALLNLAIPKEDARFILPYSLCSNFYCSVNGREFLHILRGMLYGRGSAFEEIRNLGQQLLEQGRRFAPGLFQSFEERSKAMHSDTPFAEMRLPRCSGKNSSDEPAELLSGTLGAEDAVARTALIAGTQYSTKEIESILKDTEIRDKILQNIIASSRPRALESIHYTFRLNHVSLAEVTHIARHRMQSVQFAPLTSIDRNSYVLPDSISASPEALSIYQDCFQRNAALYKEWKQQDVPEETLVYFLLSGNTMDVVTTINGRELLLFFKLRTCRRAQWEIQRHANAMLSLLRKAAPGIFQYYGPSCYVEGTCPEGRLTCGNYKEVIENYSKSK